MPPLRVEYAKSGRSRCCLKECSKMIEKGEVRVGTGIMMPGMDEPSYKWRHICCFTARQAKNAGGSVDSVEGLEDLTEADQTLILRMMKGELVNDHSLLGKTGTAGTPAAATAVSPKKGKKAPSGDAGAGPKKKARVEVVAAADGGYASDATDDYDVEETGTATVAIAKPLCPYGAGCFRKNPSHFAEYRHGDDADASSVAGSALPRTAEVVTVVAKKRDAPPPRPPTVAVVVGGTAASFPFPEMAPAATVVVAAPGEKKRCPHGALCFRTDAQHHADLLH
jgi:hypothetical protein